MENRKYIRRSKSMQQHSEAYRRILARRRKRRILKGMLLAAGAAAVIAICAFLYPEEPAAGVPETQAVHTQEQVKREPAGVAAILKDPAETSTEPETEPETEPAPAWSAEDAYMLAKIAMAEAEGEDTEGKALVILTVLNRVQSEQFPDTISEVIFQADAFTSVTNGRYDAVEPSEDCYAALALVEGGWDASQGALYFERTTAESTWHRRNLTWLCTHGNHTFYKEG